MATWGGLNPALTSWRNGINARLPGRDTRTDGARADKAHGSTSQHQEDADGTVDAFDQDINVLKSSISTGSVMEDRIIEAMKKDFQQDPHRRGQLWIEDRQIANADVGNWKVRAYSGDSPHTEHIHWQSRQSREHIGAAWPMPNLDKLLEEIPVALTDADKKWLVGEIDKRADALEATLRAEINNVPAETLAAVTNDPSNKNRTVRNHLIDLSQLRDHLVGADNAIKGAIPATAPVARVVAAADAALKPEEKA